MTRTLTKFTVPEDNLLQSITNSTVDSHVCGICGNEFRSEGGLRRHMRVHVNEQNVNENSESNSYSCKVCKMHFECPNMFEMHVQIEHSQPKALKCSSCGCFRPITDKSQSKPFKCESCSKDRRSVHFEIPIETTPDENIGYVAAVNNDEIKREYTTHTDEIIPTNIDDLLKIEHTVEENPTETTGSLKFKITRTKRGRKQKRKILRVSSVNEQRKQFKCAECNKVFSHSSSLAMHKKTHTGDFKYMCEYCDKTFFLNEYYTRHMRVHTKEKPYKCEVCDKSFSQSNTLTQHKRTHTGEKPYLCIQCGKMFGVKDYLNKHIRTHTGEKPFTCNVCHKAYTQQSGLKTHQKMHCTQLETI